MGGRDRAAAPVAGLSGRGGGWVAAQVVLLAAVFASAFVGGSWPGWLEPAAVAAGGLSIALGLALLAAGGVGLARGSALTPFPAPRPGMRLQTTGAYGLVRHPMYGGGVLVALGWSAIFATAAGLALTVALAAFADLKARYEERRLDADPGYAEYRERTRHRLIPFVW